MRLEGTLDAFSLPDIFQLLSFTKKTGALHLRRTTGEGGRPLHGVVHVRGGLVTGARGDASRQELGRRLVGTGLVDDEALAQAAEDLADDPAAGLARLLPRRPTWRPLPPPAWPASRSPTPSSTCCAGRTASSPSWSTRPTSTTSGAELAVEEPGGRGQRRLESWPCWSSRSRLPALCCGLSPTRPPTPPLPGGVAPARPRRRSAAPSPTSWVCPARGEYAVVTALAGLVGRGLWSSPTAATTASCAATSCCRRSRAPRSRSRPPLPPSSRPPCPRPPAAARRPSAATLRSSRRGRSRSRRLAARTTPSRSR
jgi:hypothetical protein